MLGEQRIQDLLQIRAALEVLAAENAAAAAATPENLVTLQGHLAQMEANQGDHPAFVEADMLLHQEIATVTGNETLSGIWQSVRALLRIWVDRSISN